MLKKNQFFYYNTLASLTTKHAKLLLAEHFIAFCNTIVPCRRPGLIMKVDVHRLNSGTIILIVLRSMLVVSHQNMFLEALATIMRPEPMLHSVHAHDWHIQCRLPFIVFVCYWVSLPYIKHRAFRLLYTLRIDTVCTLRWNELLKKLLQPRLCDWKWNVVAWQIADAACHSACSLIALLCAFYGGYK